MADPYPREEMDLKLQLMNGKIDNNHKEVMLELKQHRVVHEQIMRKLDYTNEKVKRITIALVAIGAFALGTGLQNISVLIKYLI